MGRKTWGWVYSNEYYLVKPIWQWILVGKTRKKSSKILSLKKTFIYTCYVAIFLKKGKGTLLQPSQWYKMSNTLLTSCNFKYLMCYKLKMLDNFNDWYFEWKTKLSSKTPQKEYYNNKTKW